jgi:hypothetical protein
MEILKTLHDCGHEFKECLNMKKTNCRRITTNMMTKSHLFTWTIVTLYNFFSFSNEEAGAGRIQDFKLGGGAYLKNLRRAEGGAKFVGVFRVKNHDFTDNILIFFKSLKYTMYMYLLHQR